MNFLLEIRELLHLLTSMIEETLSQTRWDVRSNFRKNLNNLSVFVNIRNPDSGYYFSLSKDLLN